MRLAAPIHIGKNSRPRKGRSEYGTTVFEFDWAWFWDFSHSGHRAYNKEQNNVRLSSEQFREILSRPAMQRANPQADGAASSAVMERPVSYEPLEAPQVKASDSGRYIVRVRSYRTRLLDQDNLAEKYHVDACRYAGLIPTDSPDQTTIEVSQEKVKDPAQARTEITIERLDAHN